MTSATEGSTLPTPPGVPGGALVTGGATRLGAAIVERLARAGLPVAIHCNASVEEATVLADRIEAEYGVRASVLRQDLCAPGLEALVHRGAEALGVPLRVLVNSAAVFEGDRADSFEADRFDRHMAVNVQAPLALAAGFARQAPEGGAIVNLLDQRVLRSNPRYFSYTLSKSTLHAATRIMAQTFAPRVRVNGVAPGLTLANGRQDRADFERRIGTLPLETGGSAAEVATVVHFLACCCPSVTGQTIAVDGGQHLAWQTPDAVPLA